MTLEALVILNIVLCAAGAFFGSYMFFEVEPILIVSGIFLFQVFQQIVFAWLVFHEARAAIHQNGKRLSLVEKYSIINGCSDEFTHISDELAKNLNFGTEVITNQIMRLSWITVIACILT